jgi:hypothetical protein
VASKNIKNGDTPDVRTALTLRVTGPLVTGQAKLAGMSVATAGATLGGAFELVIPTDCSDANKTAASAHTSKCKLRAETTTCALWLPSRIQTECHPALRNTNSNVIED